MRRWRFASWAVTYHSRARGHAPVGDLGVRTGLRQFLRLRQPPTGARLVALAAPWRPFRSLAAWYMWRVVDEARAAAR